MQAMQAYFSNEFYFCDFLAIMFKAFNFKNVIEFFGENASRDVLTRSLSDHVGHSPIFWHEVKNVFHKSIFKVQRFTCTHAHFDITGTAKRAACDGNGEAKQCHKGKGKEKVTDHAAPFPMAKP
jgi:hypothetical protein